MSRSDERAEIDRMHEAVHTHAAASDLLSGGEAELTVLFEHEDVDPETGTMRSVLKCKARIDYYVPSSEGDEGTLIDLKITRDASAESFRDDLFRNGYFREIAFCRYALRRHGLAPGRVLTVAVEREAPHAVAVYEIGETTLKASEHRLGDLLARYAACKRSGNWPGYSEGVRKLDLPPWAWGAL